MALKDTKVCWMQKVLNAKLDAEPKKSILNINWIELKIYSLNENIHLLNIATIGSP